MLQKTRVNGNKQTRCCPQILLTILSFKGAMQTLNAFRNVPLFSGDAQETYQRILAAIASHRVGDRPCRVEPRAKKRRKKNYAVLTKPRPLARKRLMSIT